MHLHFKNDIFCMHSRHSIMTSMPATYNSYIEASIEWLTIAFSVLSFFINKGNENFSSCLVKHLATQTICFAHSCCYIGMLKHILTVSSFLRHGRRHFSFFYLWKCQRTLERKRRGRNTTTATTSIEQHTYVLIYRHFTFEL